MAAVQADAQARRAGDTLQPPLTGAQQIPVNPSGQYNLSVPGGTGYELVYIDGLGNGVQISNINVPVGATQQVDVANTQLQPTGNVTMTVVDRASAQPLNNATVTLINTGTQVLSDATGVAEVQNLPPGHYAVTVKQTGYLSRYVYFQVASGQTTNLQNIELGTDKGGASGQVQAIGLSSLENIVVYAKGPDGSVVSTLTSSAGIFQFPALAVGKGYSFVASAEGFATAKFDGIEIVKGSTAAVPTLALVRQISTSKGAVSGFARFGERQGALDHAGILVSVEGNDLAAVTARDGSFVLNDVPIGAQTINFTDSNHATVTRTVTIQGGSTVKLIEINLAAVTGSISGSVTGAGGAVLAGVAISDDLGNATVTDPSGAFTIGAIPVGDRVVTLQAPGYLPSSVTVTVASGAATPIAAAPLAMSPMTLSGTVLLNNGATDHSGTTVTLQGGTLAANLTTITDAAGAFTLFGVGPGSYQILTTRPGFQGKTTPVAVLGQTAAYVVPFDISMDPAIGVVKGRVILPNAPDNSGVTVALGGQTTTTDVVGQWFLNLPEGSYAGGINYTHPDYVGQTDTAALSVAAATPVDKGAITLTRNTGSITGVVNDGATVLAGVTVTDDLGNTTVTNASGAFTLATVPVGSRTLTAIKSGFTSGTAGATVTAGATANLSATPIALTALTLAGSVNLAGATNHSGVALTLAGPGGINLTTVSNTTGGFTFSGVPDGSYQIQASKTGYSTKQLPVAVVGNTGTYTIPFALALDPAIGVVKGRVILPNAPDNSGVTVALGGQITTTDVVGQWYLNLPEGSYAGGINYSHPDYVGQTDAAAVSVATAMPVDKGSVTLTRNTGSITGTVSDGTVALVGANVTDDLGNTTVTNASGAFTLATVAVGSRTLTVIKSGFAAGTGNATVTAGTTTTIAAPIAMTALQLSGTVNLGAGVVDHSGVTLTLAGPGGINLTTTSNAAGGYTFTGVPDGSYQIQASKTGYVTKQLPVSVFNNAGTYTIPFALALDPAIGVVKGRVLLPNAPDNSGVTVALGGQTTTTDVVGQWYLNLPEGSYAGGINYSHPDYVGQTDALAVSVAAATPVDKGSITLTRNTGSISGVVNDGAAVLAGVSVTDDLGNTTTTNASGAFTLASVAVGSRTLTAIKGGFSAGTTGAMVTAGATTALAAPIALTPLQLSGTVNLGATAPDNSGVTLTLAGPGGINLTTTSNAVGGYTFTGVPDGSYQIQASKTGYVTKQLPVAVVGNTGTYTIPFTLALDPAIGVVKGQVVLPNAPDNSGVTVALGGQTTTTDIVGQWYLNLPEGNYAGGINYSHPDYVGQTDPLAVAVAAATPVDKGAVTLTRNTGSITGVVSDGVTPLVGALVTDDLGNTTVTNAAGTFGLATVAVGTRKLTVLKSGFTTGTVNAVVTAGATTNLSATPVVLTQRTLIGSVTATVGGGAIAGASVSISGGASATSDASGSYILAGVDLGTYLLWFSAPGYVSRSTAVTVANQATTAAPVASLDTAYGTLQGRVTLSKGSAADYANTTVTVQDGTGTTTLGTTTPDATGVWGVNVQTGTGLQVVVSHADYTSASTTGLNLAVGQVTDAGLLTLTRNTGTITGTVVDGGAAPLVGATLVDDLGNQATSGAGGTFTLTSEVGSRTLSVSLSGYTAPATAPTAIVTVGAATALGNITLSQRTLTGSVTATSGGAALSGVTVTVASSGATATTDALGNYSFAGLNPGTYALSFALTGYTTRNLTVVVPDQKIATAPAVAMDTAYGTLQGRVALNKGVAADYAAVTVTVLDGTGVTTLATATPDATGAWAANVQAGSAYQIAVAHVDYAAGSKTGLSVTTGQVTDTGLLTLTRNTGAITGVVQNGATPLVGVAVTDDLGNVATTNASGVFTLTSEVGSRSLSAVLNGYAGGAATATVTVGATTDLSATPIQLIALALTGSVNLGGGAANHSGVALTLSGGGGLNLTTTSNAAGAFTFNGVVDGAYQLQASKTGYVTQTRTITVVGNTGSFTAPGTVVLDPAVGAVMGRVVLPGAVDNSGVLVSLGGQTTTTDPVGQWILNLPEGSYAAGLSYSHSDYMGQTDAATVAVTAATPVDKGTVTLVAKTVSLGGTVTPATATVSDGLGHTSTAVAGSFTLAGVPAGQQTLTVTAPGYLSQTLAVTVNVDPVSGLAVTTPAAINVSLTQRALSGTVAMADGTSTAGVVVSLSGAPGTYAGSVAHDPITNTGALLVANIEPGNYNLTLSQSGFVAQTIPVSIVDGIATYTLPGTLTLQAATGTLTGRVVLPNSTENGGVVVTATGPAGSYTTTTNPTGLWMLTLPEGNIESVQYGHADYVTQLDAAVSVATPAVIASATPVDLGTTSMTAKAVSISGTVSPATAIVSDGLGHTATAVAGAFTLANVPSGIRTLTVTAPGYLSQTVAVTVNVDAVSGLAVTTPAAINVALTQRSLTGTVAMANGTTTAGVVVSLSGAPGTYAGSVTHDAVSNTGTLNVAGIEPGNYNLTLGQSGFVTQTIPVSVVDGIASYAVPGTLTLQAATGVLTGRVVLPNSVENGGVVVTATGPAGSVTTTTDPTGLWLLTLPEGNITSVQYGHADYVTQLDAAVSVGTPAVIASATPVDLGTTSLTAKAVSVSGTVSPATATVSDGLGHTASAVAGAFTLANVPTGSRTLTVTAPGYLSQTVAVTVNVDAVSGLAVTTPASINVALTQRSLSGTVAMGDGTTTAGLAVALNGIAGNYTGGVIHNAVTNTGALSVAGIEPGNYQLTLSQSGFVTQTIPVSIVDGVAVYALPVTVTMNPAQGIVQGRVMLQHLSDYSGVTVSIPGTGYTTTTDPVGQWLMSLPEKTYTGGVRYTHPDYVTFTDPYSFTITQTPIVKATQVLTRNSGSVTGTVIDGVGNPIPNASITDDLGNAVFTGDGATGVLGSFTLAGEPVGTRTLTIQKAGYTGVTTSVAVTVGTATALGNVAITQRSFTGKAALAGATNHSGVQVTLVGTAFSATSTDNGNGTDGSFTLAGVVPGNYQIQFTKAGYQTQSYPVTVLDQTTNTLSYTVNLPLTQGVVRGGVGLENRIDASGVTVTLKDAIGGVAATTTTDAFGQWRMTVPTGSYGGGVTFSHPLYTGQSNAATVTVTENGETVVGAVTLLQAKADLLLNVGTVGGTCSGGVAVQLTGTSGSALGFSGSFAVDGLGNVVTNGPLPLGGYSMTVSCPAGGFETLQQNLTLDNTANSFNLGSLSLRSSYISVNGGATYTNNATVSLALGNAGATQMRIGEGAVPVWGTLQPYATTLAYTIGGAGDGLKTIWAEYQDGVGTVLGTVSATITLDTTLVNNGFTATGGTGVGGAFTRGDVMHLSLNLGETGASATATLPGFFTGLPLLDNGAAGDVAANDGIYERNIDLLGAADASAVNVTASVTDRAGNTFATPPTVAVTINSAPTIGQPTVTSNAASGTMTVAFNTDELTTTSIEYATSAAVLGGGGTTATVSTVANTLHQVTLSGLLANTAYFYRLTATDGAGNVATLDGQGKLAPAPVTNLWAEPGNGQVGLIWDVGDSNTAGYNLYRSADAGATFTKVNALLLTATYTLDNLAVNATAYQYKVTAVDGSGNESLASNVASATPQAALAGPTTLTGGILTGNNVWLPSRAPYMLTGSVQVAVAAKLAVMPGVEVNFSPATQPKLRVDGTLWGIGEAASRLLFSGQGSIEFADTLPTPAWDASFYPTAGSVIRYADVQAISVYSPQVGTSNKQKAPLWGYQLSVSAVGGMTLGFDRLDWINLTLASGGTATLIASELHDSIITDLNPVGGMTRLQGAILSYMSNTQWTGGVIGPDMAFFAIASRPGPLKLANCQLTNVKEVQATYLEGSTLVGTTVTPLNSEEFGYIMPGGHGRYSARVNYCNISLDSRINLARAINPSNAYEPLDLRFNYWNGATLADIATRANIDFAAYKLYPLISGASIQMADNDLDTIPDVLDPDNDNDGYSDVQEQALSDPAFGTVYDPLSAVSKPGIAVTVDSDADGTPDTTDTDDDNDGLSDVNEGIQGTDPLQADSDGDGASDGLEVTLGYNPLSATSIPLFQPMVGGTIDNTYANALGEIHIPAGVDFDRVRFAPGVKLIVEAAASPVFSAVTFDGNVNGVIDLSIAGTNAAATLYSWYSTWNFVRLSQQLSHTIFMMQSTINRSELHFTHGTTIYDTRVDRSVFYNDGAAITIQTHYNAQSVLTNSKFFGLFSLDSTQTWIGVGVSMQNCLFTNPAVPTTNVGMQAGALDDFSNCIFETNIQNVNATIRNSIVNYGSLGKNNPTSWIKLVNTDVYSGTGWVTFGPVYTFLDSVAIVDGPMGTGVVTNTGLGSPVDQVGDGTATTVLSYVDATTATVNLTVDGVINPRATLNFPGGYGDIWNPNDVGVTAVAP